MENLRFVGPITSLDAFGSSITSLGDVDGDGIADVAVGTPMLFDSPQPGEVWILFLNADRTVKSERRIDSTALGGALGATDMFGSGVAALGDPLHCPSCEFGVQPSTPK